MIAHCPPLPAAHELNVVQVRIVFDGRRLADF
jgi:hypothetical protein